MGRTSNAYAPVVSGGRRAAPHAPAWRFGRPAADSAALCFAYGRSQVGDRRPDEPELATPRAAPVRRALTDAALRCAGLILLGVGAASFYGLTLLASGTAEGAPSAVEYLLAAVAFLGGSCGAGLIALGSHVNDAIEISARWRSRR